MAKYKALLVGAGAMGRAWGKNLSQNSDVDFAGWVDVVPGAVEKSAADLELAVPYMGTDFEAALHAVMPDFVVDVTPSSVHPTIIKRALRYGVPVLGEKPMADSMEEAREMVAVSEETGKLYMVSQNRRYDPRISAYKTLIEQELGPLGILNSDFYIGAHFTGYRLQLKHLLLLDMAIHTFDAARYITGLDAVSVYCDDFDPGWSWFNNKASAIAIFEMAGGLRYTYRGSWVGDGQATTWEAEWRAIGPNGTATWDGLDVIEAGVVTTPYAGEFISLTETRTIEIDKELPYGIAGSLADFLNALETGATPLNECHENIKSLAMVFAAIQSAESGEKVAISY